MTTPSAERGCEKRPDTVLVLGASGFIGSAIVAALMRTGYTVRCAVRNLSTTLRHWR